MGQLLYQPIFYVLGIDKRKVLGSRKLMFGVHMALSWAVLFDLLLPIEGSTSSAHEVCY